MFENINEVVENCEMLLQSSASVLHQVEISLLCFMNGPSWIILALERVRNVLDQDEQFQTIAASPDFVPASTRLQLLLHHVGALAPYEGV